MRAANWLRRFWWWPTAEAIFDRFDHRFAQPVLSCTWTRLGHSSARKPVLATFLSFVCLQQSNEQSALVMIAMLSWSMSLELRMCTRYLESWSKAVRRSFLFTPISTRAGISQWSTNSQTRHSWFPHLRATLQICAPSSAAWQYGQFSPGWVPWEERVEESASQRQSALDASQSCFLACFTSSERLAR